MTTVCCFCFNHTAARTPVALSFVYLKTQTITNPQETESSLCGRRQPGLAIVSHAFGHLAKEKRLMTCFTLSCDSFLSISNVWPKKHIPRVERKMTLLSDKRESINRLFYLTLDRIWFGISDFESINRFTCLSSTRLTDFVCTFHIQSYHSSHFGICKHHMEPYHIKHQHQITANHSEHSFANCYWLHMRYEHSRPT